MANDYAIVYVKNNSIQDKLEIEIFNLDLKKRIYELTEDTTLLRVESRRMHQSAHVGEYAGILIDFVVTGIPLIYTYYEIWKSITEHLKESKKKGRIIRVNNLQTLENICKYDLIINKQVKDADTFSSKVIYDKFDTTSYEEYKFYYEGPVKDEIAAEIIFENKTHKFIYTIWTDGNIDSFDRKEK